MTALRFGLPQATIEKICGVLAHYPQVTKAVIYGSRAKGNYKNGSDIDLTLYGNELTHKISLAILVELDDLLLPYTIDLSIYAMLDHADLREHIEQVGMVFYERAN